MIKIFFDYTIIYIQTNDTISILWITYYQNKKSSVFKHLTVTSYSHSKILDKTVKITYKVLPNFTITIQF